MVCLYRAIFKPFRYTACRITTGMFPIELVVICACENYFWVLSAWLHCLAHAQHGTQFWKHACNERKMPGRQESNSDRQKQESCHQESTHGYQKSTFVLLRMSSILKFLHCGLCASMHNNNVVKKCTRQTEKALLWCCPSPHQCTNERQAAAAAPTELAVHAIRWRGYLTMIHVCGSLGNCPLPL